MAHRTIDPVEEGKQRIFAQQQQMRGTAIQQERAYQERQKPRPKKRNQGSKR